ncbi:coiled-coil domain-containing protein 149-like [Halichondria panicea]|uniref:coiled-coil domain-containing protein 149-like n=1 Tax=Halichondria panicea TaxID=6063 RepID=UPI00312B7AAD
MAGISGVNLEVVYQDLLAEHKASQQQLHSKDEALKIFQKQMKESNLHKQHLEQEIKQLHSQLARAQMLASVSLIPGPNTLNPSSPLPNDSPVRPGTGPYDAEREKYILELEEAQEKNAEFSRQIQLLEDEKDEIAEERDYYSGKCSSLVKCLEELRLAKPPSHSTLNTIMEENRQLRLDRVEIQAERDQALSRIERYKRAVERRKAKEACAEKTIQFSAGKKNDAQLSLRRISELETIGNSLSESVKEKTIALAHQKRANKMLASRITELEHRLRVLEISGLWSGNDQQTHYEAGPLLSPDQMTDNRKTVNVDENKQVGEQKSNELDETNLDNQYISETSQCSEDENQYQI